MKVDYSKFILDIDVWRSLHVGEGLLEPDEARQRIAKWDAKRLKRIERWPAPDKDPEEYGLWTSEMLGVVKRPAGWPKGARLTPLNYATELAWEARRQLLAQGEKKRFINRQAARIAVEHLRRTGYLVEITEEQIEKEMSQNR